LKTIENILSEISKSLKEISKSLKETLSLQKETLKDGKRELEEALKLRDIMLEKSDQFQNGINEALGVKNKIEIDSIDLGDKD